MEGIPVWLPNCRIVASHSAEGKKKVPVARQLLLSPEGNTESSTSRPRVLLGKLQKYLRKVLCLREVTKMILTQKVILLKTKLCQIKFQAVPAELTVSLQQECTRCLLQQ